jgi:glycosyltransferase involved in cell wall biosynthesis
MSNPRPRLLYLSNAFPPGVTGRFPSINPAGHANETRMAQALGRLTDLSSVGLLPAEVFGKLVPRDDSLGLEHQFLLWDMKPELWHRWRSWRLLRYHYLQELARGRTPDILLVKNLAPVFNRFVRWLRSKPSRPLIVLVLADSGTLGQRISLSRRLRYAFKPMQTLDDQAMLWYDACIAFGLGTRRVFESHRIPWMWMPSAFNFHYDPPPNPAHTGPIRFGYFGALAEHAAVLTTVRTFLDSQVPGTLYMCGFGKLSGELKELARCHPNFRFDGLLQNQSDCLSWAQKVDVLINPRLAIWGLENTFPSKVFEFGMTGKAILSTRTGGVDAVLQDDGLYLDSDRFEESLRQKLREVSVMDRAELQRRGTAIRNRLLKDFNWDVQAHRMVNFMVHLENSRVTPAVSTRR